MAHNFRKGAAAIAESKKKAESGGGNFKPFAPRIAWEEDERKYVLFLTPVEEQTVAELHEFIPTGQWKSKDGKKQGTTYGFFVSRKDQAIGEDYDPIEDDFGKKPVERTLGVAVELEPVMETVRGRKRPTGFEVKTQSFTRKGEDDQDEEVTTPVIGVVSQSSSNFYGFLASFDEEHQPVIETPFEVKREGKSTDTEYHFVHFMDQPVDLSNVIDNVEGILYIDDVMDDLIEEIEEMDELDAALAIADAILEARLDELSDKDSYFEAIAKVDVIPNNWGQDYVRAGSGEAPEAEEEQEEEKPARRSRRSAKKDEDKPARTRRTRKPKAEEAAEEPEEAEEASEAQATKFAEMREKANRKKTTA